MNSFIQFTSDYKYIGERKTYVDAAIQANNWFKANNDYEVVSWQALSTGKDNSLTIVVEYKKTPVVDHY